MNPDINYIEINKQSWNNKVAHHFKSAFYDVAGFLGGNTSLNSIEIELLGDVIDKKILHLQCHFGMDSISLARLGANVTGVDLSDEAIKCAQELNIKTQTDAKFICCNIYDLDQYCNEQFDIIFTSYGTIGWLPDLDRWAKLISQFLKPDGRFVFAEFHPVVWMFDDQFKEIGYNYFNSGPIIETSSGSYADKDADITQQYVMWNHGIAEVMTSLINQGLTINSFSEYDYSPYDCFNGTVEFAPKKYRIKHLDNKIPMVYSLSAKKCKND